MTEYAVDLRGKVAIVTGGATGFGLAAAEGLARAGASVAICGRRAGKLASAVARISRAGSGDVFSTSCDVADAAAVAAFTAAVTARLGRIDILVNNAATLKGGLVSELEVEEIDQMVRTNLLGPIYMTRAVLPEMKRHGYGRIVNVTSGLGWKPIPGFLPYSASKAGLNAATRVLGNELSGWNILVNAIDPGVAKSELNPRAADSPEKAVGGILRLASLPAGGPTGKIFQKDGLTPAVSATGA